MPIPQRIFDADNTWFLGCDSSKDPAQTRLGGYWHGINCVNVGGLISCRPGYKCIVQLPSGKLQGAALFRPALGLEQMLVVIDGALYVAEFPFKLFRLITNIQFLPYAKQIFFQQTVQSAERRDTSLSSAITVIAPRNVIFMQDGGFTAPAFYDGSNSGHIRDEEFQTPTGGPMAWVGDRLWIANGNKVFASDISNPFSFREQVYPGGVTSFSFSSDVTAMVKIPSIEYPQLIVFTEADMSLLQADIRDRALWATTDGFQKEIAQVGCTSHRSLVSHYGRLSWMTSNGVAIFDASTLGKVASRLPIRDNELFVSKIALSDDLSLVASAGMGQFLLFSVPRENLYNLDTWVLNNASLETLNDDSGPSWMSVWLGTRPVEWVFGQIAGQERAYHVSFDEDGFNRLWETFTEERLDNGVQITWGFFTRAYFGPTGQSQKAPGMDCRFTFADVAVVGIEENLDVGIFYAGGLRGGFKPIFQKRINVERGAIVPEREITMTTQLFGLKPQARVIRTEDANQQEVEGVETGSCPPESDRLEDIDESFQLCCMFHGPAGVRYIRAFAFPEAEDTTGNSEACSNQTPFNAVRFDGAGVTSEDLVQAIEALDARPIRRFTSNMTEAVTQGGITAIGVGFAESVVSQEAADRAASRIANLQAQAEVNAQLPPVLSIGEDF